MKKPKLVSDWRKAWRWYSVNIPTLNAAFLGTWAVLPPHFQNVLPLPWMIGIAVSLLVLGTVGRLIEQEDTDVE